MIACAEELAATDRELASVYGALMARLGPEARLRLRDEQRTWLRRRDRECTYKWVLDCARMRYAERLAEPRSR